MSFAYHMRGNGGSVGNLTLEIKVNAGAAFVPLFSVSGNQGSAWNLAQVELPAISYGENVQFRLRGTTASSFLGDIAVDEFCFSQSIAGCTDSAADNFDPTATVDDGSCTTLNCGSTRSLPFCRGFEGAGALNGFVQDSSEDFDWLQRNGPTVSMGTGPSAGNTGSGYVYVEASQPNSPFKKARLETPCFDLTDVTTNPTPAVSFAYHMWGSYVGQLRLQASTDGENWTTLWVRSGDKGNQWNQQEPISLTDYNGGIVKLRFVGITVNGWQGDMAIDDLCVENAPAAKALVNVDTDEFITEAAYVVPQSAEYSVDGNFSMVLYPNPIDNGSVLNIELLNIETGVEKVEVSIFDITGRKVMAEQFATNGSQAYRQLHLSNDIAGGTYIVSIAAGNIVKTQRLVISK